MAALTSLDRHLLNWHSWGYISQECNSPILMIVTYCTIFSEVIGKCLASWFTGNVAFWSRGSGFDCRLCHGISSEELFHGVRRLGISMFQCHFVHIMSSVGFGGGPCTLLTTGQRRFSNCLCVPMWFMGISKPWHLEVT